jgi:hypothetical protein
VFALADNANDQPTADLLTQRMQMHEKTAWILRGQHRLDQRPNQQITDRHHLNGSRIDTIAPINRTSPEHDRGVEMGAGSEGA